MCDQGHNRKIFLRGQSHFPDFCPGMKCFFPVGNFHFGRPKTNFIGFEKWEAKKKVLFSFVSSIFNFPPFTLFLLFFSIFIPFPFSLDLPCRSTEISQSEVSGGTLPPPHPCLLRHCVWCLVVFLFPIFVLFILRYWELRISWKGSHLFCLFPWVEHCKSNPHVREQIQSMGFIDATLWSVSLSCVLISMLEF